MGFKKQKRILITAAVAIVAILLGWGAHTAFDSDLEKASSANFKKEQKLLTKTAANEIERYYSDVQKRLEIIAMMPVVRDAVRSETCNQTLQNILQVNSSVFNNLGRVGKDGTFICAVNRTIVGEPAAKYGTYFAEVAKDPEHKPVMSRLIYPSGSGTPVAAVHVPVYDSNGQFNGTIGGAVYFDELEKRILLDKQMTEGSAIALFDNNGDILYHQDPLLRSKNLLSEDVLKPYDPRETITSFVNDVVKGKPSEGEIQFSFKDKSYQSTYKSAQVIGRHWTVRIAVPHEDVHKAVHRETAQQIFLATTALAIIAVTALTYIVLPRNSSGKKRTNSR